MLVRLLYAASEHDADILYPTGFFAPDPFLCLITGSRTILVMSDLEMDRAKRESKATDVWSWTRMAKRAGLGAPPPKTEHVIAACLKRLGARSAEVPGSFPLGLARKLEGLNIKLRVAKDPFWPEREIKTRDEVKKIETSLRAAEAGLLAGIDALKSTMIGRDGWLRRGGSKFTSEDLRGVVDTTILKLGGIPVRTICAGGDQAVDPHEIGHGPLRAHSPIVMDIFPVPSPPATSATSPGRWCADARARSSRRSTPWSRRACSSGTGRSAKAPTGGRSTPTSWPCSTGAASRRA